MKKLSLNELPDSLQVVGQSRGLNLPNRRPFRMQKKQCPVYISVPLPHHQLGVCSSCVPVTFRGVHALQGVTHGLDLISHRVIA